MRKLILLQIIILIFAFSFKAESQLIKATVALTGSVIDQTSKEPISADIVVFDEAGKKINSTRSNASESGYYYVVGLTPGLTYHVVINEKGFFKEKYEVKIPYTDRYLELSKDLTVKPLAKQAEIKLQVPPFELHKSKLRYGAGFLLNDITNTLVNNPNVKFKIVCYPDSESSASKDANLTKERAESIMDYFVIQGVDPVRISTEGKSNVDPNNPPPTKKTAKGKRYVGSTYIVVTDF